MANLHSKRVNGNLIFWDTHPARWIDAIGPNVAKIIDHFNQTPFDGADTPAATTVTLVEAGAGESTVALEAGADSGVLLITTDAADNDGVSIQWKGEAFKLSGSNPCYFGARLKLSEVIQSDILVGLCITDTALLGGMTDGAYFRKVDASAVMSAVLEKDSAETTATALTMVDDTYVFLEIYYDGTSVHFYVNGVELTLLAQTNLPNDEWLTPSIEVLTGEAVVKTCRLDKILAIQAYP